MAKARFHPQVWNGDLPMEVEPEGLTEWDVGRVPADWGDDSMESDELRFHPNAPEWVRGWSGPFWIEIIRAE